HQMLFFPIYERPDVFVKHRHLFGNFINVDGAGPFAWFERILPAGIFGNKIFGGSRNFRHDYFLELISSLTFSKNASMSMAPRSPALRWRTPTECAAISLSPIINT